MQKANSDQTSLWRRLTSLLCLLAVLIIAVPCPSVHQHAGQHADCCAPSEAVTSSALCCTVHPQPADQFASATDLMVPAPEQSNPALNPVHVLLTHAPRLVLTSPPPLLSPILRI